MAELILIGGVCILLFLGAVLWKSYHFTQYNRTVIVPMSAEDVAGRGVHFGSARGLRITQRSYGTVLIESEPKINWALFLFLLVMCGIACLIAFATRKRENISILATDLVDGRSELVLQAFVQGRRVRELERFLDGLSPRTMLPSVSPMTSLARADAIPTRVVDEETATLWSEAAFDRPPPPKPLTSSNQELEVPTMPMSSPSRAALPPPPASASRLRMTTAPAPPLGPVSGAPTVPTSPTASPPASALPPASSVPSDVAGPDAEGSKFRGTMGRKPTE